MGSASTFYIKDTGTYDLEMSGSNVFALSSNVVGSITGELVWKSNEDQILYGSDPGANDQFWTRRCCRRKLCGCWFTL